MTATDRFRPTRAGIINLWDYRDEEFVFADGRLVLRGPNGSGKTKALEVLFPFVLDGRIEPRRLNPFASEERTMRSNLLYRGQDSAYSYVWMEFAAGGETPTGFVTVGVGLRATRQNDKVTRWYFVADGRIGVEFSLLTADDRPLGKRELAAQLPPGSVVDRSVEHRAAVDARLFGLGPDRYEQLLKLVLTLRRPQLAKNLDPKGLSQALTEGLRPLDDTLIAEAARSFGDMESVQQTLESLVGADDAARGFLADYLTYLRTHSRAAADRLSARIDDVTVAQRQLRDASAERSAATDGLADAEREQRDAAAELGMQQGRLESLRASPGYRDREQLDRQAALVAELGDLAAQALSRAESATREWERRRDQLVQTAEALKKTTAELTRAADAASEAAADAGIDWVEADGDAPDLAIRAESRAQQRSADVAEVRRAVAEVASARTDRDRTQALLERAERHLAEAQQALDACEAAVAAQQRALTDAIRGWAARHEAALAVVPTTEADGELDAAAPDTTAPDAAAHLADVLIGLVDDVGTPTGRSLVGRFDEWAQPTVEAHHSAIARWEEQSSRVAEQLAELEDRREAIATEKDDAPPAFAARTADRSELDGAPLWQLVRFVDGVTDDDAAGIEAALHAANLLDAWVLANPPSNATDTTGATTIDSDTVLAPLPPEARPKGPTLAQVLRPDDPVAVPAQRVADILASIRLDTKSMTLEADPAARTATSKSGPATPEPESGAATTVTPSGWFRAGIQVGSHHAPAAQYIGATARARRREQRLAELDSDIADVRRGASELHTRIDRNREELGALSGARTDLPATGGVASARQSLDRAAGELAATHKSTNDARSAADKAVAALSTAHNAAHRLAAERNIAADTATLDAVAAAIDAFLHSARDLALRRSQLADRREAQQSAESEVAAAATANSERRAEAELAAGDQQRRQAELDTLREAIGASAEKVDADIAETKKQIEASRRRGNTAQSDAKQAAERSGAALAALTAARERLTQTVIEAQRDALTLRPFAATEIRNVLAIDADLEWPATSHAWPDPGSAVTEADRDTANRNTATDTESPAETSYTFLPPQVHALHQAILAATADLRPSESSLKSSSTRMSTALGELQARLSAAGHEYRPEWNDHDGIVVVRVADEDGYTPIGTFAARIGAARRDQEQLLTESERRILADAILGRLAQQIHTRTLDARDLIGRMSAEMMRRRMSSGASIGITWEKVDDLGDEHRAISSLLERDAARLDGDDLARMRSHFAGRIKDLRAARPDRSYVDILGEALDYRQWRTFQLTLTSPGGKAERLTKARHSTLSGGEQSVSLHLPLFAAAHVMLASARSDSPRLVAMDEAFAGIDDSGRGELLGLTVDFDLDLFMTGHDLWATYGAVPGCAHYDLAHVAVEHTVSALLMVWDGGSLVTDPLSGDLAMTLGSPGTRRVVLDEQPTLT